MVVMDDQDNWVFSTAREQNLLSCTVPDGILQPGQIYKWYVRVGDSSDWIKEDNRSNGAALTFTMAGTLSAHSSMPAIDLSQWAAVNWTRNGKNGFNFAIVVVDHDGVAYDGSSHIVSVTTPAGTSFPDGTTEKTMKMNNWMSPTSAEYGLWLESAPPPGEFTLLP